MTDIRQPKGIPAGGQFAEHIRAESEVKLFDSRAWDALTHDIYRRQKEHREFIAVAAIAALREEAPTAVTARFERREDRDGDGYYLAALIDADGNETSPDPFRMPRAHERSEGLLSGLDDWSTLGYDDERDYDDSLCVKHVPLDSDFMDGQAQIEARLRRNLAAAEAGHGDVMPALLDTLAERFELDGQPECVEVVNGISSDQITGIYESRIGPMLDEIEQDIYRASFENGETL